MSAPQRTSIDLDAVGAQERYAERQTRKLIARANAAARAATIAPRKTALAPIGGATLTLACKRNAPADGDRLGAWAAAGGATASLWEPACGVLA